MNDRLHCRAGGDHGFVLGFESLMGVKQNRTDSHDQNVTLSSGRKVRSTPKSGLSCSRACLRVRPAALLQLNLQDHNIDRSLPRSDHAGIHVGDIAAVLGDGARHLCHNARMVGAVDRQHKRRHLQGRLSAAARSGNDLHKTAKSNGVV